MENYIVSARKYRPQTFDAVVGQSALTTTLRNAIASGKLAHAYLFCGPRGVGKTTCARIFAKTINCLTPTPEGDACGHCESCVAFDEGRSYNIHELDAASNNSVDDIRSLIEQVSIPPQIGRYKVFIIDEVHMLSTAAFNAFLKTLEEPPAHAIFILATTEKHKVLPTILSRCQIYDFNRMETEDITGHLRRVAEKEGIAYEEEALAVIAQKADGGMRDALSIFDQISSFTGGNITYQKAIENLNVLDYDYYFRITDSLLAGEVTQVLLTLNEILAKGFSAQHFIGGLASHFRDLLVSRDAQTLPLLEVSQTVRQHYQEQALRCQPRFLYRALRLCNDCDINYRQSRNKRLLVELTLIEVAQAAQGDDTPSSGLGPTKKLNPVFPAAQQEQGSVQQQPVAAIAKPVSPTSSAARPTEQAPMARPTMATVAKNNAQGRLRTVSLHTTSQPAKPVEATPTPSVAEAPAQYGNKPFDQSDVDRQWLLFAASLPQEQAATAGRLKNMAPKLEAEGRITACVESEAVLADMNAVLPQLHRFLRRELDNSRVDVRFEVAAHTVARRAFSQREQLSHMLEKSEAFSRLHKALELELA
ncbi:MAG: DNA polymerase III subunit gamma/tau [Alloprevotella sp.]|nr:DNA polymerase III subunit gamma/tau [Alloprevotella sp.]MBR1652830.1 DNA polymerase III subunit gamma/tau [Alloprevotella sp.]